MRCPFCSSDDLKVVDKRPTALHDAIRRRRECLSCSKRFTTYERIENINLVVIKKDGRREPFDRNKVRSGIVKACQKRPVSIDQIEKLVDDVEYKLRRKKSLEIPSRLIGELVIKKLRSMDKVAYIRFASVYKEFDDPKFFEDEVKLLKKKNRG
ncbi:MAG: transcriptional regulator NrdR [Candidatus Nanoarchaeia archaeon]